MNVCNINRQNQYGQLSNNNNCYENAPEKPNEDTTIGVVLK